MPTAGFLSSRGSSASQSLTGVVWWHVPGESKAGSASPDLLLAAGEDQNHKPDLERESSRSLAAADPSGAPLGMGAGPYSLFRVSREMPREPTCPRPLCEALHCLGLVQKGCCSDV